MKVINEEMAFGLGVNDGEVWQSVPDRTMSQGKGLWWEQAPYHWGPRREDCGSGSGGESGLW